MAIRFMMDYYVMRVCIVSKDTKHNHICTFALSFILPHANQFFPTLRTQRDATELYNMNLYNNPFAAHSPTPHFFPPRLSASAPAASICWARTILPRHSRGGCNYSRWVGCRSPPSPDTVRITYGTPRKPQSSARPLSLCWTRQMLMFVPRNRTCRLGAASHLYKCMHKFAVLLNVFVWLPVERGNKGTADKSRRIMFLRSERCLFNTSSVEFTIVRVEWGATN